MSFDPNSNAITTDPEYLLNNPLYIKQAHDLLVHYGIVPSASNNPDGTPAFGIDAATQQEADANPYSVAAMLRKGYAANLGDNNTNAVSHGALNSGAFQNANLHSLDNFQSGLSNAGSELQGKLGDVAQARIGTVGSIWNRLSTANSTPTADTTSYGPAAAPPDVSIGHGLPVPQGPYQRTGPETPGAVAKMVKPKAPGFSGRAL